MSDLITRQAAIDAINQICPIDTEYDCTLLDRVDVRCVLTDLPSAQPEQRWIPCSERLPEERGFYLTTTKDKAVYCDYWNEDNFDRTEMVIAWMPLPEAYRGGDEQE